MKQPQNAIKNTKALAKKEKISFSQEEKKVGLIVTGELDKALEECKTKVAQIAKDCRSKNRRYRWDGNLTAP